MFGLVASLAEKTVCAPAAAFTSGVAIGKKHRQQLLPVVLQSAKNLARQSRVNI